jgi:hypothetical protein
VVLVTVAEGGQGRALGRGAVWVWLRDAEVWLIQLICHPVTRSGPSSRPEPLAAARVKRRELRTLGPVELFILWGAAAGPGADQLTFAASQMNFSAIGRGSRTMIEQMLVDLGLAGQAFRDWSTRHFRTNFYAELDDALSDADAWFDTWEITLDLQPPVDTSILAGRDPYTIIRTYARDDTWTGAMPPKTAPYVLVAEFGHVALLHRARAALAAVGGAAGVIDTEVADLIQAVQEHPLAGGVSMWRDDSPTGQLTVQVGAFDSDMLAGEPAQELILRVSTLLREYGADMLWYNYNFHRCGLRG